MVDLLTPIRELVFSPPTRFLDRNIAPGDRDTSGDLPVLIPGTPFPSYGLVVTAVDWPPAVGRNFTEIATFQRPYVLVTLFSETFSGSLIPVERHRIYDRIAEIRWFGPGIQRISYELTPGFLVNFNYLYIPVIA